MMIFSRFRFLVAFVSLFIFTSTLIGTVSIARAETATDTGFSALQGCMDSEGASLNLVYLMDISKSMSKSDPKKVRAAMLASSLQLFYQVSKDSGKKLNFTFVSFGSTNDTSVTIPWSPVNAGNITQQISKARTAASQESSYGTDWYQGLSLAQTQIKQKRDSDPNACFVFSWITDGQIDLNPNGGSTNFVPQDRIAYQNICKQSGGLINWFRSPTNNIATLGALLSQNANKQANAFNSLSMEEKSVSLFRPVIEGFGEIPSDVADKYSISDSISEGNYECGRVTVNSHLGKLVSSGQAEDLAWQFLDLVAHLRNLNKAEFEQNGGSFQLNIDNSVGRIEVFTKGKDSGKNLTVKDSKGLNICDETTKCRRTENTNWTEWTVDIPGDGVSPGNWVIEVDSGTPPKIFVGSQGDPKQLKFNFVPKPNLVDIIEGNNIETTATLVHEDGTAVTEAEFKNVCIELTKPATSAEPECIPGTSIPIKFNAEITNDSLQVTAKYQFNSSQEHGQVTDVQRMKVKANNLFAKLTCANIEQDENGVDVCRLNPIPNSHQKSITPLFASVGEGTSKLAITGFKADDSVERVDEYLAEPLYEEVAVSSGATKSINFVLTNTNIKNRVDDVYGLITYSVSDQTGQVVTSQLKVVFSLQAKKNGWVIIICYVLALLLGVGLPYLLLLINARRSAIFVPGVFKTVTIPVKITDAGTILTNLDSQNSASSETASDDLEAGWQPLSFTEELKLSLAPLPINSLEPKTKELTVGPAELKVSNIRGNAFAPINVSLEVPSSIVISNRGIHADELRLNVTSADQNLSGLVFVFADGGILEPISDSKFVLEAEDDFSISAGSGGFVSNMIAPSSEFEGMLVAVLFGEINYARELEKIILQCTNKNWDFVGRQLQELRKSALEDARAEKEIPAVSPQNVKLDNQNSDELPDVFGNSSDGTINLPGDEF